MTRTAAVVVFQDGVSEREAIALLATLKDKIKGEPNVQSYEDEYGGPVFYIP